MPVTFEILDRRELLSFRFSTEPGPFIESHGAIFDAAVRSDGTAQSVIHKLNFNGKIDTAWGNDGSIAVNFIVRQLAYNDALGFLFAVGDHGETGDISVLRLNAKGRRDKTYWDRGEHTFNIPDSIKSGTEYEVQKLITMANGSLVIGVMRTNRTVRPPTVEIKGTKELLLLNVRPSGVLNRGFGNAGVKSVFRSTYIQPDGFSPLGSRSSTGDLPTFESINQISSIFETVLSLQKGQFSGEPKKHNAALASSTIKLLQISTAGQIDSLKAYSWSVSFDSNTLYGTVRPILVYRDSMGELMLIGSRNNSPLVGERTLAYQLKTGKKAVVMSFGGGLITDRRDSGGFFNGDPVTTHINGIARTTTGQFYSPNDYGTIDVFSSDFSRDKASISQPLIYDELLHRSYDSSISQIPIVYSNGVGGVVFKRNNILYNYP